MKKLKSFLPAIMAFAIATVFSCNSPKPKFETNTNSRIKLIEETRLSGASVSIISVDGVEYILTYNGCVTPLLDTLVYSY